MNHYEVLGVGKNPTPEELKVAKQRAAKKHHPDKGGSTAMMVLVNKAYETLSDPQKKEYYDLNGEDELPRPPRETQALQLIYNILLQLSEQMEDGDFVGAVRQNLIANRQAIKDSEPQFRRKLRITEKQRTRIRHKKKEGVNLLVHVFDQKIGQIKEKLASIPEALAMADECLKILDDYECAGEMTPSYSPRREAAGFAQLLNAMQGVKW